MIRLELPLPLVTLNEIVSEAKHHWSSYAASKRRDTDLVAVLARSAKLRPCPSPFRVRCEWHPRDRRIDPDNLAAGGLKAILDGLQVAGVIEGDGYKHVRGIEHDFGAPDRQHPHVVVEIESAR